MQNAVKKLRQRQGLSQQALAKVVGSSQPTIAMYESDKKSPTLSTLKRMANEMGFEVNVEFIPTLTREDRRSLFYHQKVAELLKKVPAIVIKKAEKNLKALKVKHSDAHVLFDEWSAWLRLPLDELINRLLDPGLFARDMRQVSPFAGVLSAKERAQIIRQFKKEERDEA